MHLSNAHPGQVDFM